MRERARFDSVQKLSFLFLILSFSQILSFFLSSTLIVNYISAYIYILPLLVVRYLISFFLSCNSHILH